MIFQGNNSRLVSQRCAMKVVIVDDSVLVQERLTIMFAGLNGVEVVGTAQDAPEGTSVIRELNPDVVILDIKMPVGSGIDVLRDIKESNPLIKVVILTNYPYEQYRRKCMDLGAEYFFDKSSEFERIPEILEQLRKENSREDGQ